ncbi:MAG: DNA mismatch repair endonuclease MutL [Planctomycetes bacterium]|nr:DNA mismatch repair endonuclease MutL [Planctomycetota bacterium]
MRWNILLCVAIEPRGVPNSSTVSGSASQSHTRILALDPIVVDQIAAGEVVERPANVVKELVENAIDAGATRIEVLLREGGARRIEVRDNGQGILVEDLPLAVRSHATSKLREPGDLEAVASLGFRGEALASIASVSRLEIISLPSGQKDAASLLVDFGKVEVPRVAAGSLGTRIVVDDLFAQLPARLKFLKRASTELAHCTAWLERLALAHEGIGFRLEHDGRQLLEIAADADLDARCAAVYGPGLAGRMLPIERETGPLGLQGRIGPPESARRDARRVDLFLNGRWVRDPRLLRAVREGVREFVPTGHYPTLCLQLAIAPDRVDVNVHPQKTEVRFRDERLVFGAVLRALQEALADSRWSTRSIGPIGRSGAFSTPTTTDSSPGSGAWSSSSGTSSRDFRSWDSTGGGDVAAAGDGGKGEMQESRLPLASSAETRVVGPVLAVANTFLVREVEGGMEILDQHALHERVNLEELRRELQQGQVVAQPLLVPSLVDVGRAELNLLMRRQKVFSQLGVEIEAFGENTVAIRTVPARLTRLVPEKLVRDLLAIAEENKQATPDRIAEEMLHSMACRGAVMAGDRLDAEALQGLLERGADLPQDRTCAHGRPVRVFLTIEDLEKAFYRRM